MAKASLDIFRDRPDLTAALRHVVWEFSRTHEPFGPTAIEAHINDARCGMGLKRLRGGAATTLVQQRTEGAEQREADLPLHYRKEGRGQYAPAVEADWRFFHGHSHSDIRAVAREALLRPDPPSEGAPPSWLFVPRAAYLPVVRCWLFRDGARPSPKVFQDVLGLYIARLGDQSYIGQTHELHVRWRHHQVRDAEQVVFAAPLDEPASGDLLDAAEALSIAAFAELLRLANDKYGHDRRPQPAVLRQASAFALVFHAATVRLAADGAAADVLAWRPDRELPGLRERYLRLAEGPAMGVEVETAAGA